MAFASNMKSILISWMAMQSCSRKSTFIFNQHHAIIKYYNDVISCTFSYRRLHFVFQLLCFSIHFQYLGDWYEIYKFEASFEGQQRCIRANYQMKEDGHIRVQNTGIECVLHFICFFTLVRNRLTSMCSYKDVQYVHLLFPYRDGKSITAIGDGYAPDKNVPAKLEVRFSDSKYDFDLNLINLY